MKCGEESTILLSSLAAFFEITDLCDHKFCESCFKKENTDLAKIETYTFSCPCCPPYFMKLRIRLMKPS